MSGQYKKFCFPGEVPEFIFENLDDISEEHFFSRGDVDLERKLGFPSSSLINQFESAMLSKISIDDDHTSTFAGDDPTDVNINEQLSIQTNSVLSVKYFGGKSPSPRKRKGLSASERYLRHNSPGKSSIKLKPLFHDVSLPNSDLSDKSHSISKLSRSLSEESNIKISMSPKSNSAKLSDDSFYSSASTGLCNGMVIPSSPRSKFILGCLANNLNPSVSLIVRDKLTRRLGEFI